MDNKKKRSGFRERNGKLEYRFRFSGGQYSVVGDTERECKAKAQKLATELAMGLKIDAKRITWKQYTEEWIKTKETTCRKSTIHAYRKSLKMLTFLDNKKMVDIDRRDILQLQSNLAKKYSSSTTNWLICKVREIFYCAMADEIIIKNPVIKVTALKRKEPKATSTIHRALSKDEQAKFFEQARKQQSWYLELYEFMLVTGMRVGEAGALRWRDIGDHIHVRNTVSKVDYGEYALESTKTSAGCRDLPLTNDARDILHRQKEKLAMYCGISYTAPDKHIFVSARDNKLINSSMIDSAMELICESAKIDKRSSHAFRDTYATRCILQGMQPNTLKTLMGHTKIEITMNLYAQVLPENMDEAMQSIKIL